MTRDELAELAVRRALEEALGPLAGKTTATVEQTAVLLGISRSSGYDAARRGQIPTLRIGRRLVVSVAGLVAMLLGAPNGNDAGGKSGAVVNLESSRDAS